MSHRPYSVLIPRSFIDLMVAAMAGSLGSNSSTSTAAFFFSLVSQFSNSIIAKRLWRWELQSGVHVPNSCSAGPRVCMLIHTRRSSPELSTSRRSKCHRL